MYYLISLRILWSVSFLTSLLPLFWCVSCWGLSIFIKKRSPKVDGELSVYGIIRGSFSLVPPSAIPFLWRTFQTPASWLKPSLALDVCIFHSISIFHLDPHPHNPYAWSVRLPQRKFLLSPVELFVELCGTRIGATSYNNPSIFSLTSTTFHGAQHLALPVSETFRILCGKMACCMLLYLPQPAFHCVLPLFF